MDEATAESTLYVLCFIIAPFLLCLLLQYGLGRVRAPRLQPWLALPLPLLAGGIFLFSLYQTAAVTGWGRLGWEILDYMSLSALAGTGLGWLLARKKQK